MSNGPENDFHEKTPVDQAEVVEGGAEHLMDSIGALIDQLGFTVSPELREAGDIVTAVLLDDTVDCAQLRQAWIEYAKSAEQVAESIEGTVQNRMEYIKSAIAAIIHKALIFRAAGNTLRYLEELDRAEAFVVLERFDDISLTLQDEIDSKIETLEMSPIVIILKLRGEIEEASREQLRERLADGDDMQDILGDAYSLMLMEDGDAEEVFRRLGLLNSGQ